MNGISKLAQVIVASVALVACKNAGSAGNGGGGAGGGATTGTASTGTGKTYAGHGVVIANDLPGTSNAPHSWSVFAAYEPTTDNSTCVSTTYGACVLEECAHPSMGTAMTGGLVPAGTITITAGQRVVTLTPNALNGYMFAESSESLVEAGQTIAFAVAGAGAIPPHTGSVVAPYPVTVTTPALGSDVAIDRTKTFPLAWSNGKPDDSVVALFVASAPGSQETQIVNCTFDAASGGDVVPIELLSKLPVGSTGTLDMHVESAADIVEAGDWQVRFLAQGRATQGTNLVTTKVVFQ